MAIDQPGTPGYEPNPLLRAARSSSVSTDILPSTIFHTSADEAAAAAREQQVIANTPRPDNYRTFWLGTAQKGYSEKPIEISPGSQSYWLGTAQRGYSEQPQPISPAERKIEVFTQQQQAERERQAVLPQIPISAQQTLPTTSNFDPNLTWAQRMSLYREGEKAKAIDTEYDKSLVGQAGSLILPYFAKGQSELSSVLDNDVSIFTRLNVGVVSGLLGVGEVGTRAVLAGASFIPGIGSPVASTQKLIDRAPSVIMSTPSRLWSSTVGHVQEKGFTGAVDVLGQSIGMYVGGQIASEGIAGASKYTKEGVNDILAYSKRAEYNLLVSEGAKSVKETGMLTIPEYNKQVSEYPRPSRVLESKSAFIKMIGEPKDFSSEVLPISEYNKLVAERTPSKATLTASKYIDVQDMLIASNVRFVPNIRFRTVMPSSSIRRSAIEVLTEKRYPVELSNALFGLSAFGSLRTAQATEQGYKSDIAEKSKSVLGMVSLQLIGLRERTSLATKELSLNTSALMQSSLVGEMQRTPQKQEQTTSEIGKQIIRTSSDFIPEETPKLKFKLSSILNPFRSKKKKKSGVRFRPFTEYAKIATPSQILTRSSFGVNHFNKSKLFPEKKKSRKRGHR